MIIQNLTVLNEFALIMITVQLPNRARCNQQPDGGAAVKRDHHSTPNL
jgi:hypothetical protein